MWMQIFKYIIWEAWVQPRHYHRLDSVLASSGLGLISYLDSKPVTQKTNTGRKERSKEARRVRNETYGERKKVRRRSGRKKRIRKSTVRKKRECENKGNAIIGRTDNVFPSLL